MITLFKEITTEEALKEIEKESEKWDGLYCDMDNKEERKFVKDNSKNIEDIRKKVERARIDKTKDYKVKVEAEAKSIDSRLVAANKPFISLIDEHKEKRAKILAAEKEAIEKEQAAIQKENDHDYALLLNDKFDSNLAKELVEKEQLIAAREREIRAEEAEKVKAEKEQAIQAKIDAEEAVKQAVIDKEVAEKLAAKQKIEADERAAKLKIENDEKDRLLIIQTKKNKKAAAENARLAEVKRQEEAEKAEKERIAEIESNRKHVSSVRSEIKEQIMKDVGIDEETAIKVVKSILKMVKSGRIKISYE